MIREEGQKMAQQNNALQEDATNAEDEVLAHYPWLRAYRQGNLFSLWVQERERILRVDSRLSERLSARLAQAYVIVHTIDDTSAFERSVEEACRRGSSRVVTEIEETIYLWIKNEWNLKDDLVTHTDLEIWLPYQDLYRAHANSEQWCDELFSPPQP